MENIFKAKRLDNGEWVEFNLEDIRGNNFVYVSGIGMLNVDLKNCCQYAGINDSQGNRIFEGDEFTDGSFVIMHNGCLFFDSSDVTGYLHYSAKDLELTGHNIHDRG